MKLSIKNLAKIKEADIEIDGITVICGNNNTGKSTVGKALFAIFESTLNIYDRIREEIASKIINVFIKSSVYIRNYFVHHNNAYNDFKFDIDNLIDKMYSNDYNDIDLLINNFVKKNIANNKEYVVFTITGERIIKSDSYIESISDEIKKIITTPIDSIKKELISRYFNSIFNEQINNTDKNNIAYIDLIIKEKTNKIIFNQNKCKNFNEEIIIGNNIYYIDNPFIIDKINNSSNGYTLMEKKLINALEKDYTNNMLENIIDSVQNKEILDKIGKLFDDAVNGKINKMGSYYYLDKLRFENLSTGIKSFIIIRMLLESGSLKEKDLLVLDEPEIHLHPEWQLLYAETIVLLQKYLDLTITITTHSPYFVEAINGYSKLHKIHNRVNFYFAEADDNNNVTINKVNDNINLIFKKMADPLKKLRNMRIEEFDNSKSEE
ncbi:AAA family ATPase [Brachyspira hyodysenteriae]|uniref:AAA family ATPase n=1 Tax=Brachyspira hyodysenteriae TaxID=159 RepID=UPI00063DB304|nr:AAA family ATPase [Brachyspira hyodysenteriae]AUJ50294.1 ABC transporter ATP-binding protein [Brachyspira hyodysenteriae]KLI13821.1 ABC transporter ATP-binding protein [Brachyspira hyodysenteriae]KLI46049.1 ABC transporter ATP-binding protein [Brachyspira hyodysenteriae]KLI56751.1 ABC transporter ATP-binding protein [Brachyspira hyodysenteriae]MCZ9956625.1 ATP-binding protein [Brachyspira hyodysenteriae]